MKDLYHRNICFMTMEIQYFSSSTTAFSYLSFILSALFVRKGNRISITRHKHPPFSTRRNAIRKPYLVWVIHALRSAKLGKPPRSFSFFRIFPCLVCHSDEGIGCDQCYEIKTCREGDINSTAVSPSSEIISGSSSPSRINLNQTLTFVWWFVP